MKEKQPIVSICCVTYNHAPFIRKALDGFLMQEPPMGVPADQPWYEILIHDDASTDGTTEIIREYAAKHPNVIFPLYETENQYMKGGDVDMFNYNRVGGRYVAYCEGDDYWTDACKLRKQVEFMESHPEYSVCFHDFDIFDVRDEKYYTSKDSMAFSSASNKKKQGVDISVMDYFHKFGQPMTMLFRTSMFDKRWREQYRYYRDTHEIYHLLRAGKGYWMNFKGATHIRHKGGISTSATLDMSCVDEREHIFELYQHNKTDKQLKDYLVEIMLWNYDVYKKEGRIKEFRKIVRDYILKVPDVVVKMSRVIMKRKMKSVLK